MWSLCQFSIICYLCSWEFITVPDESIRRVINHINMNNDQENLLSAFEQHKIIVMESWQCEKVYKIFILDKLNRQNRCFIATCPFDETVACSSFLEDCKNEVLYPSSFDTSVSDELDLSTPSISSQKPHLLGSVDSVSFLDKEAEQAVKFGIEKWNRQSNNLFTMVATGPPLNMTRQVIAGIKYTFVIRLATSICRNEAKFCHDCEISNDGMSQQCKMTVLKIMDHDGDWVNKLSDCKCDEMVLTRPDHSNKQSGKDDMSECHQHKKSFKYFKSLYNKTYSGLKEENHRLGVFCKNMKRIQTLLQREQWPSTAKYGITKFADLSESEFRKYFLTPYWNKTSQYWMKPAVSVNLNGASIPDYWDWAKHGAVTPVKNQGMCGSCWAFSTTGNIEGQYAIQRQQLLSLSEQELVDCDKLDDGCEGGLPSNAYSALMKLGGLEKESDYKYLAEDEKCSFMRRKVVVRVSGAVNISSDEEEIKAWLYKNGPISIGINAFAMQFYMGGISHPWKILCNPDMIDHGVLITGYGVHKPRYLPFEIPYWIIKNSWGEGWGEKGYYLVYRGKGVCGLNQMATSATIY